MLLLVSFDSLQAGKCSQSRLTCILGRLRLSSFDSLQAGRCIQRAAKGEIAQYNGEFRFPSNGKAYPKEEFKWTEPELIDEQFRFLSSGKVYPKLSHRFPSVPHQRRFDSLQAGRRIQTFSKREAYFGSAEFRFPSTGKAQSDRMAVGMDGTRHIHVSIPFKREGTSRRARC